MWRRAGWGGKRGAASILMADRWHQPGPCQRRIVWPSSRWTKRRGRPLYIRREALTRQQVSDDRGAEARLEANVRRIYYLLFVRHLARLGRVSFQQLHNAPGADRGAGAHL